MTDGEKLRCGELDEVFHVRKGVFGPYLVDKPSRGRVYRDADKAFASFLYTS